MTRRHQHQYQHIQPRESEQKAYVIPPDKPERQEFSLLQRKIGRLDLEPYILKL